MNMPPRNRKRPTTEPSAGPSTIHSAPPAAYVQAYEAALVYGASSDSAVHVTAGLIEYGGDCDREIWADRHDIIHLLPSLPSLPSFVPRHPPASPSPSSSSSTWSLPADVEETWYLSDDDEIQAYKDAKKRKWMEALREERLRERAMEDLRSGKAVAGAGDGWHEDEEPPEAILTLMTHTAKSILTSPNPTLLEARIMAHHSKDERFAFLRGRFKSAWEGVKVEFRKKKDEARRMEERQRGLGGLGGYESDSEGESGDEKSLPPPPDESDAPPLPPQETDDAPPPPPPEEQTSHITPSGDNVAEEEKQRQRRLRAEEWKRKRAEASMTDTAQSR